MMEISPMVNVDLEKEKEKIKKQKKNENEWMEKYITWSMGTVNIV